MTMVTRQLLPLTLLACALFPGVGSGQVSTTRGLSLGFHLSTTTLSLEGGGPGRGTGAGFRGGYGLNRSVTVFAELDGASIHATDPNGRVSGSWALGQGDLGVRFHFANSLHRVVPWVEAALSGRVASVGGAAENGDGVNLSGSAYTLGGGLSVYLERRMALDVGLSVASGGFTELGVGSITLHNLEIGAKSTRFSVGLVWWP